MKHMSTIYKLAIYNIFIYLCTFCLGFYPAITQAAAGVEKGLALESSPLIPRALLFGNPEKASPKLSPDGTKLAYLAPDAHNVLNVFVRDLGRAEKDAQVTQDTKQGIGQFMWQLNNASILYIQDADGDENGHLYQTHLASQTTKDLTPFNNVKAGIVAADPRFPDEMLIQMNKRNPDLFDVFRLNLITGDIKLDTENPGGVIGWIADHNFSVRASQSLSDDGATVIRVRNLADSPWREWMTIDPSEIAEIEGFTQDNQHLYIITSLGANTSRLLKVNLESGDRTVLAEDPDYDLEGITLNPISKNLEAVGIERERYEWIVLDPQMKADFQDLSNRLTGSLTLASRDLANQTWVVSSQSDQRPTHYYVYRRPSKTLEFLFTTQPALERYPLSPMQPIRVQARDKMMLHGYLTLPYGKDPRNLPTVLLVHGGPWSRDCWGMQPIVQWLANRGYAVCQVNFRGSTGYGKAYLNAGNREWANKMHHDLLDSKEWLISKGYADPAKIAIMGGSYGGYATLVGLSFTPDAFCCGVDIVGPSNLVTLLQSIPSYWKPLKSRMDLQVGKLETEEEFLKSISPLFKADQITKPLLIAQGANDPRVKKSESDQIVHAMREKKLPVEYLLFHDEGHGFARPENRLKFYAAAESFLSKYLGGRQEAASLDENWESLKH